MAKQSKGIYAEALLEAQAIKDIALNSAKQKIYESQDSYLRDNLSEKLAQMNEEESEDEEVDLSELLSEIEAEDEEVPTEPIAPEGEEMSDMTDEDADKAVSEMSSEELIALIRDAVSQELASQGEGDAEIEAGEEGEAPEGEGVDMGGIETDDEEIDLDELLNEVDAQLNPTPSPQAPVQTQVTQGNFEQLRQENQSLKTQLAEAMKAIKVYKQSINESKLFASKSNHLTKIFAKTNLSESQKKKIAERFDKAKNEAEVKLVYDVLKESFGKSSPIQKPKNSASNIIGTTKTTLNESLKGIIGDTLKARMQELAGIRKSL